MNVVEQWFTVWKRSATTWASFAVNLVTAHALVFMAVLPFAPLYWQLPLAIGIAILASAPTWAARIWKQPKLTEKIAAKEANRDP